MLKGEIFGVYVEGIGFTKDVVVIRMCLLDTGWDHRGLGPEKDGAWKVELHRSR